MRDGHCPNRGGSATQSEISREMRPARLLRAVAIALGPGVFVALLLIDAPKGMPDLAWHTTAAVAWMAIWWLTEAIPVAATALLPLVLFPFLGISNVGDTAAPFANPIIFLFLGGFMLAAAMERWNLHRRIALNIVRVVGTGPRAMVGGFMVASAFLSMWISNTATAVMMLPIAMSMLSDRNVEDDRFAHCMLLGIAFGSSIGGLGTLIGTPPNALLAGYMSQTYSVEIGFGRWMLVGVPLVVLFLPLCWLLLTRLVFPVSAADTVIDPSHVRAEIARLGSPARGEKLVALVFAAVVALWLARPLLGPIGSGLSDAGIAIAGALALFVIPAGRASGPRLLDWPSVARLPWGVLILFGGGLTLAAAIQGSGLATWVADGLAGLSALPIFLALAISIAIVVFLTELTSNTATAATFLPIASALAIGMSQNPLLFTVPIALAASCAFMMPVATPPNAIVFGSGRLTVGRMARAGIWLNLLSIGALVGLTYVLFNQVFGVTLGEIPTWVTDRS